MSAFKQLNSQDIIVSPLEINKGYEARTVLLTASGGGYGFIDYGLGIYGESPGQVSHFGDGLDIERYLGKNTLFNPSSPTTGYHSDYNPSLIYNSVKHLYYHNYISGTEDQNGRNTISDAELPYFRPDGVVTGSAYNTNYESYLQSNLLADRTYPTGSNNLVGILSISSGVYGDYIQPGSFKLQAPAYSGSGGGTIYDDGEGRLISGSNNEVVGNIIYTHGIAILTNYKKSGYHYQTYATESYGPVAGDDYYFYSFFSGSEATCSFSSSYTMYETQYKCTIGESEYNYTQNPTALSGSNGNPYGFVTSSFFSPYVTTVGLYNDAYELLAVGKLGKPLPTSNLTDTTILVNIDRQ